MLYISLLLLAAYLIYRLKRKETFKINKIIDGDSLYINNNHIRLKYIDTPELNFKEGQLAKKFLINLLKEYTINDISYLGTDKYNRNLAEVDLDKNLTLNEILVLEGYAIPTYSFLSTSKKVKFKSLHRIAKNEKRGLYKKHFGFMTELENKHSN